MSAELARASDRAVLAPNSAGAALVSDGYFIAGTVLNRIYSEAPHLPRCSDDKTARLVRPRRYALKYPYMQINPRGMVCWLIFDLDHTNSFQWRDADLPAPNLIVRDRTTGKSHLYYAIVPVCTSIRGRAGPIAYMRAIYRAMAEALDADENYHSGPVAKTPGHPWWDTSELHSRVYQLGDLAGHVELKPAPRRKQVVREGPAATSRHCALFDTVRYFAYDNVGAERDSGSFDTFYSLVEAYAQEKNNFGELSSKGDLSWASVRATAKSIARWTWENYTGSSKVRRGVMRLQDDLALVEKQRLAAVRTNTLRSNATMAAVRSACGQLAAAGKNITQVAVAALLAITRQTVAKYAAIISEAREAMRRPSPADYTSESPPAMADPHPPGYAAATGCWQHRTTSVRSVKSGAYQIAGALGLSLPAASGPLVRCRVSCRLCDSLSGCWCSLDSRVLT